MQIKHCPDLACTTFRRTQFAYTVGMDNSTHKEDGTSAAGIGVPHMLISATIIHCLWFALRAHIKVGNLTRWIGDHGLFFVTLFFVGMLLADTNNDHWNGATISAVRRAPAIVQEIVRHLFDALLVLFGSGVITNICVYAPRPNRKTNRARTSPAPKRTPGRKEWPADLELPMASKSCCAAIGDICGSLGGIIRDGVEDGSGQDMVASGVAGAAADNDPAVSVDPELGAEWWYWLAVDLSIACVATVSLPLAFGISASLSASAFMLMVMPTRYIRALVVCTLAYSVLIKSDLVDTGSADLVVWTGALIVCGYKLPQTPRQRLVFLALSALTLVCCVLLAVFGHGSGLHRALRIVAGVLVLVHCTPTRLSHHCTRRHTNSNPTENVR